MPRGALIIFEGIDGCGKGTQINLLERRLAEIGLADQVVWNKEPGGTALGEEIRKVLFETVTTHAMDVNACSLLYLVSQLQALHEVVLPALAEDKVVISDRWDKFSGTVFGLKALRVPVSRCVLLLRRELLRLTPDLIIWLRGDPDTFFSRATGRTSEVHEQGKAWADPEKLKLLQLFFF